MGYKVEKGLADALERTEMQRVELADALRVCIHRCMLSYRRWGILADHEAYSLGRAALAKLEETPP